MDEWLCIEIRYSLYIHENVTCAAVRFSQQFGGSTVYNWVWLDIHLYTIKTPKPDEKAGALPSNFARNLEDYGVKKYPAQIHNALKEVLYFEARFLKLARNIEFSMEWETNDTSDNLDLEWWRNDKWV